MTKYMTKTALMIVAIGFILSVGFAVQASHTNIVSDPQPSGVMANYYASNPTNVSDLKEKWGNPVHRQTFGNGITKLTFGPYDSMVGYTIFLSKNGMVVDKRFSGSTINLQQLREENHSSPQM